MPDRTQEIKNLRAVATACKNYTDNKINDLQWQLGTYDLGVETVNGTTKLLPTPANTIQATMVRVDGASEVSENLIVLNDVAETTVGTLTYSIKDGVLTLNGTGNGISNITNVVNSQIATMDTSKYTLKWFAENTGDTVGFIGLTNYYDNYINIDTGTTSQSNGKSIGSSIQINSGATFTNAKFKPMLVSGSTAPSEFKVGYTGIHNLELSGLKVEGANLWDVGRLNITKGSTVIGTIGTLEAGTYTISWASIGNISAFLNIKVGTTVIKNVNMNTTVTTGKIDGNSFNFTLNETSVVSYAVDNYYSTTTTTYAENVMLNRGSTALSYVPYVAPTTKTIDLSTILYNGSPLFEGNSLKGVGNVADEITPYKATKKVGYVDLGSLDWQYMQVNNLPTFTVTLSLAKPTSDNAKVSNLLTSNYTTISPNSNYAGGDKVISLAGIGSNSIWLKDSAYTDATTFKTAMSGVYLVYELATPIEVSIDFSQLVKFEAHSNGSIMLVNTNNQDTTSTFKYLKEVAK